MTDSGVNAAPGRTWPIVEKYEGPLLRYTAQILGDLDRARDVVQDAFMRYFREDPAALAGREAPWLYTVCRNRALDMIRKDQRIVALEDGQADRLPCPHITPSLAAEQGDNARRLVQAMETLPPRQREVVLLKFQGGLSYKEIGEVTKLTVSHVGVLLHTAIKALRQEMQEDLGLAPAPAMERKL